MSQQNVLDVHDSQQNADKNQNQAVIAGAVPPNDESLPVFKLYVHYWDDVFDWLSVEDVHSFGRTCKSFQKVTGEYFKSKYPSFCVLYENCNCKKNVVAILDFIKFLTNYDVHGCDEFDEHVILTYNSLKQLSISGKLLSSSFTKKLKPILPSLETIDIRIKEEVYLATKWASMQTNSSLIEIQRIDSCQVKEVFDHIRTIFIRQLSPISLKKNV